MVQNDNKDSAARWSDVESFEPHSRSLLAHLLKTTRGRTKTIERSKFSRVTRQHKGDYNHHNHYSTSSSSYCSSYSSHSSSSLAPPPPCATAITTSDAEDKMMDSLLSRRNSLYTSLAGQITSLSHQHHHQSQPQQLQQLQQQEQYHITPCACSGSSKSDCDSDDMSSSSVFYRPSNFRTRPQSVSCPEPSPHSIQHHHHYHSQPPPTLDEVLCDRSLPPYTRGAFTAFLSQNHCLESLEFFIDAKRYDHDYDTVAKQLGAAALEVQSPQTEHLCQLWQRLLTVYIYPASPREINVTGEVRDELLSHSHAPIPPNPKILESAVKRIHELMEESIFIPFINSFASSRNHSKRDGNTTTSTNATTNATTTHDRSHSTHLSLRRRFSAQPYFATHSHSQQQNHLSSPLPVDTSPSASPTSTYSFSKNASFAGSSCPSYHSTSPSSDPNSLPEDSTTTAATSPTTTTTTITTDVASPSSLSSSSPASTEPMTPPTTPPTNEWQCSFPPQANGAPVSLSSSVPCQKHKENAWKKMGLRLGFKKKTSGMPVSPRENHQLSPAFPTD